MINSTERRFKRGPVEVRGEDNQKRIEGYAAVFYREGDAGTEYELWDGARERIMPGAFDDVLARSEDVYGLFNHSPDHILGRTKSGTLKISVDDVGLRYEISPSGTRTYSDVMELLERGDLDGSSFAFRARGEGAAMWSIDEETGEEIREIRKVSLLVDVGPVAMPAYSGTTAGARSGGDADEARADRDAWRERARRESVERESFLRQSDLRRLTGRDPIG